MIGPSFVKLTDDETGDPILIRVDRIESVSSWYDSGGAVIGSCIFAGPGEDNKWDVKESVDEVAALIATVAPVVVPVRTVAVPPAPAVDFDVKLGDLAEDCGNGYRRNLLNSVARNALYRKGIRTIGDLMKTSNGDLIGIGALGAKSYRQIDHIKFCVNKGFMPCGKC